MKTRSGFVSNSSSTSFTIIVTPKQFKAARATLETEAQKMMDAAWPNPEVFKVDDVTLWDISFIDQDGGYWQYIGENIFIEVDEDDEEVSGMDREEAYELGKEIIKALKDKGAYIREKGY